MWSNVGVNTNVLADFLVIASRLNACQFESSVLSALITPFAPSFMISKSWVPSGRFYLDGVNPKMSSVDVYMPQLEAPHFALTNRGLLLVGLS